MSLLHQILHQIISLPEIMGLIISDCSWTVLPKLVTYTYFSDPFWNIVLFCKQPGLVKSKRLHVKLHPIPNDEWLVYPCRHYNPYYYVRSVAGPEICPGGGGDLRNVWPVVASIFFLTTFNRAGGPGLRGPLGSATAGGEIRAFGWNSSWKWTQEFHT